MPQNFAGKQVHEDIVSFCSEAVSAGDCFDGIDMLSFEK
jgi:hypothetical protein